VKDYLGVDMVVGNHQKDDLVEKAVDQFGLTVSEIEQPIQNSLFLRGRHRAFIKVQDGCRYRCTYCIVTIARGEERSRSIGDIIDEINSLHQQGIQEIAVTGVHVGGYGSDIDSSLTVLLAEILKQTDIPRIRLASVEPWDLPDDFFELFQDSRLMPHMHLPIQSGCDSVLKRMARRCKTEEFSRILQIAREANPFFNVTTDIIVGFPGETEDEWQQTMNYVEQTGFGHMHIFSFSPREGTKAAGLSGQIDKETKKCRSQQMHDLATRLKIEALTKQTGRTASVLWEQQVNAEGGLWSGYTPEYHKVLSNNSNITESCITEVSIDQVSEDGLTLLNQSTQHEIAVSF
jgi:threonylcarbamoyladenosine tRNA methylthiotransferase MtaB